MKKCNDCGKNKPLTCFGKRKNLNKTKTVYYKAYCKDCVTKRTQDWQQKNLKRYYKYMKTYMRNLRAKV